MSKYIIYQTTNLINGKTYIGRHKLDNSGRHYIGSGANIINAIKKYGKHNFKRDILFTFNNFKECKAKEEELVTIEFVLLDTNYNLIPGGGGNKQHHKTKIRQRKENLGTSYTVIKNDDDQFHNRSGPAIINENGTKEWYVNGKRHRGNDLPAIERADGSCEWYTNGVLHRDNTPAIIHVTGLTEYWKHGKQIKHKQEK